MAPAQNLYQTQPYACRIKRDTSYPQVNAQLLRCREGQDCKVWESSGNLVRLWIQNRWLFAQRRNEGMSSGLNDATGLGCWSAVLIIVL